MYLFHLLDYGHWYLIKDNLKEKNEKYYLIFSSFDNQNVPFKICVSKNVLNMYSTNYIRCIKIEDMDNFTLLNNTEELLLVIKYFNDKFKYPLDFYGNYSYINNLLNICLFNLNL